MPKKRHVVPLPETDADLHYPESLPQAERESLAGEARLAELRKQPEFNLKRRRSGPPAERRNATGVNLLFGAYTRACRIAVEGLPERP